MPLGHVLPAFLVTPAVLSCRGSSGLLEAPVAVVRRALCARERPAPGATAHFRFHARVAARRTRAASHAMPMHRADGAVGCWRCLTRASDGPVVAERSSCACRPSRDRIHRRLRQGGTGPPRGEHSSGRRRADDALAAIRIVNSRSDRRLLYAGKHLPGERCRFGWCGPKASVAISELAQMTERL